MRAEYRGQQLQNRDESPAAQRIPGAAGAVSATGSLESKLFCCEPRPSTPVRDQAVHPTTSETPLTPSCGRRAPLHHHPSRTASPRGAPRPAGYGWSTAARFGSQPSPARTSTFSNHDISGNGAEISVRDTNKSLQPRHFWQFSFTSFISSVPTLFEQNQLVGRIALDTHRDGFSK